MIRAVPQAYAGVHFRSTLEAEWAYNLDKMGIVWSYEPVALEFDNGRRYLPDFWLPEIKTWFEVKGPDVPGLDKTMELLRSVHQEATDDLPDRGSDGQPIVVVLGLAPARDALTFRVAASTPVRNQSIHVTTIDAMTFRVGKADGRDWASDPTLGMCKKCRGAWWFDGAQSWRCRRCGADDDGKGHIHATARSGEMAFYRCPWGGRGPGWAAPHQSYHQLIAEIQRESMLVRRPRTRVPRLAGPCSCPVEPAGSCGGIALVDGLCDLCRWSAECRQQRGAPVAPSGGSTWTHENRHEWRTR